MADYIDRQAALDLDPPPKHLRQYQTIITVDLDDVYEDGWYDFQTQLLQLPPADVRPVRRGRWDRRDKKHFNDFYCSNCQMLHHHVPTIMAVPQWSFCPNCGAQMGGDAE